MTTPVSASPVYTTRPSNPPATNLKTAQPASVARPQTNYGSTFTSQAPAPKVNLMDVKSGGGGHAGTVIGNSK